MKPTVKHRIWSFRRKLLGNLVPFLFSFPFAASGILAMYLTHRLIGVGLALFVLGLPIGILALNYFGFFENEKMRKEVAAEMKTRLLGSEKEAIFVGIARPGFNNLLDPHEDVGFLVMNKDNLEFIGEKIQAKIDRSSFSLVTFKANPHSLLGLGRWISMEGVDRKAPFRFLIEPREKKTLIQNRKFGKALALKLEAWVKSK